MKEEEVQKMIIDVVTEMHNRDAPPLFIACPECTASNPGRFFKKITKVSCFKCGNTRLIEYEENK